MIGRLVRSPCTVPVCMYHMYQRYICTDVTNRFSIHKDYQAYNALNGNSISLPCNITPPSSDDGVSLILWYRDDLSTPIYTVDARSVGHLQSAKHFNDVSVLTNRATFNITYPVSYLRFNPAVETDTAEYRCRVDFRRGRTINRVMQLNVIVPTKKISIYDTDNNYINDIAGPFNEDSELNLTCESEGGNPLPNIKWWHGDALLTDKSVIIGKSTVRGMATFEHLQRQHLMMPLTCEATNTNLTMALTKTVLIDLNLKPTEVRIIEPIQNMTVGQRVELVCQSSGSRPPAKITWKKNQKLLEHYSESTSDDGAVTTNFLTFVPTKEDDGKLLACMAFNPQFSDFRIEDSLHLDVHYAPILSLLLGASIQRQEILEGSDVYFDCNIQANPQVHELGWLLNGNELSPTNGNERIEIRNNSIIISNVNVDHIGAYQCYAANTLGKSASEVVNLNVKYSPTCATENELFLETQPFVQLTIECQVRADPVDVQFYWEFNSSMPADNVNHHNEPLMEITNTGLRSELKFTPRSSHHYGTLYCYGQNRIGQQQKPCIVHVAKSEVPNAPENCSLTNVTVATLTVQCSMESTARYSEQYNLEIYNDANNQLVKNVSSSDGPTFQVSDLPPGFSFNLVVYATNKNGHSEKVRINANTLVGEPRKLEHIEQKINVKPFLMLAFVLACLLAFILIVLFVLVKLRNRYKTKNKSRKPCSVFDTSTVAADSNLPPSVASSSLQQPSLSAYSLQMRSCTAVDNLATAATVGDSTEIITLGGFGSDSCNGIKNGVVLNHLTSNNELMGHPYLELTNLDRILSEQGGNVDVGEQARIIDQKQATDYPLVHSSKDHVAICPEMGNISGELMYLHATVTDNSKVNTFYSDCLVLDKNGITLGNGVSNSHVSTIPCIILNESNILYGDGKECDNQNVGGGTSYQTTPMFAITQENLADDCLQSKSNAKVRFSE
ncbi:hypothetical protein BLOT_007352 [Blomia tropicalis]|nr:hypothetical protein BLOT_007352 [Blomia tropicalis]